MLNPSELFNLSRVVHTGSFMRAAAELGISQPALSKSVARLERTLGVRLLERKARGVVATPFAEVLLQRTLPLIADLHAAAEEIEAMKGGVGGSVAIGVAPAVAASFLPSVVERLRESGRPIGLRVTEGLVEDLLNGVRNGVFDIAVTTRTASVAADEFRVQTLFEDRFVVCCAPSNPLSRQAVVEPGYSYFACEVCHEREHQRTDVCGALPKMREGPSRPACRSRPQTATSCVGKEPSW